MLFAALHGTLPVATAVALAKAVRTHSAARAAASFFAKKAFFRFAAVLLYGLRLFFTFLQLLFAVFA